MVSNDFADTIPTAEAWPTAARLVREPRTGRVLAFTGKTVIGLHHRPPRRSGAAVAVWAYRRSLPVATALLYLAAVALCVAGGVVIGYW